MAEQTTIHGTAAVVHHGPIRRDCPVECMQVVLSQAAYRPLARAEDALFPPPGTVGDVLAIYVGGGLPDIRGLGPRRISEIEAALVLAGFNLSTVGPLQALLPDAPSARCRACGRAAPAGELEEQVKRYADQVQALAAVNEELRQENRRLRSQAGRMAPDAGQPHPGQGPGGE